MVWVNGTMISCWYLSVYVVCDMYLHVLYVCSCDFSLVNKI